MWVFINALIENPAFDSQTKENMTLQAKQFGSKCELSEKYITQVMTLPPTRQIEYTCRDSLPPPHIHCRFVQVTKCGIIEHILNWVKFKAQSQLNKKSGAKTSKLKGIPKLDDANEAGTRKSEQYRTATHL